MAYILLDVLLEKIFAVCPTPVCLPPVCKQFRACWQRSYAQWWNSADEATKGRIARKASLELRLDSFTAPISLLHEFITVLLHSEDNMWTELGGSRQFSAFSFATEHLLPRANSSAIVMEAVFVAAAGLGHVNFLQQLAVSQHVPRGDCYVSTALSQAARGGFTDAVRLVLTWPNHAPRATSDNSAALFNASFDGHVDVMRLLLSWGEHAPHANQKHCLEVAAMNGHVEAVRLLLSWHTRPALAFTMDGAALISAASQGHDEVVRTLLSWPSNPAHADCRGGEALIEATTRGHMDVVHTLLSWPSNPARADSKDGAALKWAARYGTTELQNLLQSYL
jgi:hypothetical protein